MGLQICTDIAKAVLNQGMTPSFFYLRTQTGLEVDLLVEGPAGRLTPFEFKLAQTPRAEMADGLRRFASEFAELQPERGYVVSLSERRGPLTADASLLPFAEFCEVVPRVVTFDLPNRKSDL